MENQILFKLRTSFWYRKIRLILYYLFEYKKYKQIQENIIEGKDTSYSYLRKYKGLHSGDRCFIIATGPSLKTIDLSTLKNEFTIGVNALCMKFDDLGWNTNYFVLSDYNAFKKMSPILTKKKLKFFSTWRAENNPFCEFVPTFVHNCYMIDYAKKIFTNEIEAGIGSGNTVVLQAIQIAAYMGFKNIYLLGVDCNYEKKDADLYFVDHGIRMAIQHGAGLRMISDFKILHKYEKQWGINIYNATNGGMLEVFPRVNLQSILKNE